MNNYFKPPFNNQIKPYIFSAPNEKTEYPKAFDIVDLRANLLREAIVSSLNDEYPAEALGSELFYELQRSMERFTRDDQYVKVELRNGNSVNILKVRGWGMLTGRGEGGFGLDPEVAAEIQSKLLDYAVEKLETTFRTYKEKSSLKNRMLDLRSATDSIRLDKDQYVLIMCDGHCFSKAIKKKYKLPFDPEFIDNMNTAAIKTAKNIQGFIVGYVQSDEVSFLLHRRKGSPFFDYRLEKMVSLVASWMSVNYMAEVYKRISSLPASPEDIQQMIYKVKPVIFDGRAFNLPTDNDAFAWFLWRQNDCVRNSKNQAAQTYLPFSRLHGVKADDQIKMLKEEKGIDWENYKDGEKYGRLIYRENIEKCSPDGELYIRTIWPSTPVSGQFGDELRNIIKNGKDVEGSREGGSNLG